MRLRTASVALLVAGLHVPAAAGQTELTAAVDRVAAMDGVRTVLVQHGGALVAERGDTDSPRNVKSLSKSILSAAVGIAISDGLIEGIDQPVAELLPDAIDWSAEPAKRGILVRHLLTMTAGLAGTSGEDYGAWVASPDWVRAALARPLVAEPGETFIYSTGNTHVLSAALARSSGMSTREYVERAVLSPIGAAIAAWDRSPQGIHMGGNNLALTPRDLLALGELYLNRGRLDGRRVLPSRWVDESTQVHSAGWPDRYGRYGYLWWVRPSGAFMAVGYGGQLLYVAPAHGAVVVVLSTPTSKGQRWDRQLIGRIENELLPVLSE